MNGRILDRPMFQQGGWVKTLKDITGYPDRVIVAIVNAARRAGVTTIEGLKEFLINQRIKPLIGQLTDQFSFPTVKDEPDGERIERKLPELNPATQRFVAGLAGLVAPQRKRLVKPSQVIQDQEFRPSLREGQPPETLGVRDPFTNEMTTFKDPGVPGYQIGEGGPDWPGTGAMYTRYDRTGLSPRLYKKYMELSNKSEEGGYGVPGPSTEIKWPSAEGYSEFPGLQPGYLPSDFKS